MSTGRVRIKSENFYVFWLRHACYKRRNFFLCCFLSYRRIGGVAVIILLLVLLLFVNVQQHLVFLGGRRQGQLKFFLRRIDLVLEEIEGGFEGLHWFPFLPSQAGDSEVVGFGHVDVSEGVRWTAVSKKVQIAGSLLEFEGGGAKSGSQILFGELVVGIVVFVVASWSHANTQMQI